MPRDFELARYEYDSGGTQLSLFPRDVRNLEIIGKSAKRRLILLDDSQGKRAIVAGHKFRDRIAGILSGAGYPVEREVFYGKTEFGDRMRADLIIHKIAWFDRLVIETKWQSSSGTVNKSVVHDAARMARYSPLPCIMVYGGPSHSRIALHLAAMQVGGNLIEILNTEELHWRLDWLANGGTPIKEPWQRRYAQFITGDR